MYIGAIANSESTNHVLCLFLC